MNRLDEWADTLTPRKVALLLAACAIPAALILATAPTQPDHVCTSADGQQLLAWNGDGFTYQDSAGITRPSTVRNASLWTCRTP